MSVRRKNRSSCRPSQPAVRPLTSPVSTIRPTRLRFLVSTRWWCTAPTTSSGETAQRSGPKVRSLSTRKAAPASTAASAWSQMPSRAARMPAGPSETGQVV